MKKVVIGLMLLLNLVLLGCGFSSTEKVKEVNLFNSGLLAFRSGEKWGYINVEEEIVIEAKYDRAGRFNDGEAIVRVDEEMFLIDPEGEEVLDKRYTALYRDEISSNIFYYEDESWGIMDNDGNILTEPIYDYYYGFYEGLSVVNKNGLFGYVNTEGEEVTEFVYENAMSFSRGLGVVQVDRKWGAINELGETVIDFEYDWLSSFDDNELAVGAKGTEPVSATYYLIDKDNDVVLENQGRIHEGGPIYPLYKDDKYYIYDKTGDKFVEDEYLFVVTNFGYAVALYQEQSVRTHILFNEDGTIIKEASDQESNIRTYKLEGKNVHSLIVEKEPGLTLYLQDDSYYINADHVLFLCTEERFVVARDEDWGLVDKDNNVLLDFEYSYIYEFDDGYFLYMKDEVWGVFNSDYSDLFTGDYDYLGSPVNIYMEM
jgi:hypothetical protein